MLAASEGHKDVVVVLLEAGADVHDKNNVRYEPTTTIIMMRYDETPQQEEHSVE